MSVVIIGAGHAGVAAATALRKLDKSINITLISVLVLNFNYFLSLPIVESKVRHQGLI